MGMRGAGRALHEAAGGALDPAADARAEHGHRAADTAGKV